MEEHARDAEDSARRGPARRARRPRASTADSGTDSADEAPPPPRPKKKRPRYKSDDPRRNPPPSVANLLADRNASLERAASVSSTASTSTAKVTFYVDETVMGDECLLINGSEEEGVTAYVAQTLACGVCQEPYRRATRPPSGEVVKWPPGSADDEGQVLTPYVSTRSTSKAIKNLTQITSYARFMRKKMRGETRVKFTKVKKAGVVGLLRRMPRHLLVPRAVRIANDCKESVGMFVDRKILSSSVPRASSQAPSGRVVALAPQSGTWRGVSGRALAPLPSLISASSIKRSQRPVPHPDGGRPERGGGVRVHATQPLRPSPAGRVGPGGAGGVRGTLRRN